MVFQGAFDAGVVDRATAVFLAMIAEQKAAGVAGGDHFAKPGANDRVWGALDKFAVRDPEAFADYYANDVARADLRGLAGPGLPGHLAGQRGQPRRRRRRSRTATTTSGSCPRSRRGRYPAHVHLLSPALTLQGAVAHVDMPVETGPTLYLPHSQKYPARLPRLPPARVHRLLRRRTTCSCRWPRATPRSSTRPCSTAPAPTARADVRRMANLLQVSSAFGRAMETRRPDGDERARSTRCCAARRRATRRATWSPPSAEGYAFPTNLDRDQPIGGLAPQTQAELLLQALAEKWPAERFAAALEAQHGRRQ